MSFPQELTVLFEFTERSSVGAEQRSILAGVGFSGPYICVNTRQLKSIIGRCKSSINGSFQQLGYCSIKTKSADFLAAILPSLAREVSTMRQWTVRCASVDALFCFVSRYPRPEDPALCRIQKEVVIAEMIQTTSRAVPIPILPPNRVNCDLCAFRLLESPAVPEVIPRFAELVDEPAIGNEDSMGGWDHRGIDRSQEAVFPQIGPDWDF